MTIFRDVLFSLSFALGAVAAAKFVMVLVGWWDRGQSIKARGDFRVAISRRSRDVHTCSGELWVGCAAYSFLGLFENFRAAYEEKHTWR
jgi:hypothetical protein